MMLILGPCVHICLSMSKDAGERVRFNEWLQCNSADKEFIKSSASCGFNSKLFLQSVDVKKSMKITD